MKLISNRAGKLIMHETQYQYYFPKSLFDVDIEIDDEMSMLLSKANNLLGKLDGISMVLPNKDILISMYVQKEAVVSSQIEGTQVSLVDVLQSKCSKKRIKDINDVVNYVKSLNKGIDLLKQLPICTRYFKQIHSLLLNNSRGEKKNPGELRTSQNWIGPNGCGLTDAIFVPPCPSAMQHCLSDLEKYMNSNLNKSQSLIDIALIHYQFETIHPFLDGNGRLGRILIPLWLINKGFICQPILYLSLYFKQNRNQYYSQLMDVRFKGNYESWIKFFLRAVIETANDSIETIKKIIHLKDYVNLTLEYVKTRNINNIKKVVDYMYKQPYFTSKDLCDSLKLTRPTVLNVIDILLSFGIISKIDQKKRNSTYCFTKYVSILETGTNI